MIVFKLKSSKTPSLKQNDDLIGLNIVLKIFVHFKEILTNLIGRITSTKIQIVSVNHACFIITHSNFSFLKLIFNR